MHRTVSLDYAVVPKGSTILHLDDGSITRIDGGPVIVQGGKLHAWEMHRGDGFAFLSIQQLRDRLSFQTGWVPRSTKR